MRYIDKLKNKYPNKVNNDNGINANAGCPSYYGYEKEPNKCPSLDCNICWNRNLPAFLLDDYKGRYVMHCNTKEQAKNFCEYLHSQGKEWYDGKSYAEEDYYYKYEDNTYYVFNMDTFENRRNCKKSGFEIIEYEWFDWSIEK